MVIFMIHQDLDQYDAKILSFLQEDARFSMAELGRKVNLSQPAVTERVRKLEAAGIILGYKAVVDSAALGYAIRAMVRVGRCDFDRVLKVIRGAPEIRTAYNITGEDSWLIDLAVTDVAHLDAVLTQLCALGETSTSIVLKTMHDSPVKPPIKPSLTKVSIAKPVSLGKRHAKSAAK
jgi:Lrp/AsnC family transcriptional regulator, leucine-responsive regulatory protein